MYKKKSVKPFFLLFVLCLFALLFLHYWEFLPTHWRFPYFFSTPICASNAQFTPVLFYPWVLPPTFLHLPPNFFTIALNLPSLFSWVRTPNYFTTPDNCYIFSLRLVICSSCFAISKHSKHNKMTIMHNAYILCI